MKNWRTSLISILYAAFQLAQALGLHIPPDVQQAITTITIFLIGILAADSVPAKQGQFQKNKD